MHPIFNGEVWREVDPRLKRWVKIVDVVGNRVLITRCTQNGIVCTTRRTMAKRERFNGKRGGYEYCFSASPSTSGAEHG